MDKGTKKIEFEAICENMSFDGKGCVHYKNHVGFIPSLLEGEKARIVMTYYTSNQFTGYVKELLSSSKDSLTKQGLSEERLAAQVDNLRPLIAFYRQYPDLLIDSMTGFAEAQENGTLSEYKGFRFYFYQRIFLRVVMRHRFVYATFPRA